MSNSSICLSTLFECDLNQGLILKENLNEKFIGYIINIYHTEIDKICELVIQCQSKLLIENLTKTKINDQCLINNNEFNQGFLIHQWSIEKLKEILSSSESSLICIVDENNNKLAGYLLLTSKKYFFEATNHELGEILLDNNRITDQQWKQYLLSSHIHYIKQIGVDKEYHRQGIATHLIILAKNQSNQGLCTLVMCSPYSNTASAKCFERNQFQSVAIWNQRVSQEFISFKATVFVWPSVKSIIELD